MKPWQRAVDTMGNGLMRAVALGLVALWGWLVYLDWVETSSLGGLGFLPIILVFLAYGLRPAGTSM